MLHTLSNIPSVIFGTSGLGNLFQELEDATKSAIVKQCIEHTKGKVVFDSAGKYGAGLALEALGKCLGQLNIPADQVIISNKLGWFRTKLKTTEPTFEPGVWKGIHHDAVQKISYDGILECYEQGNELLNGYNAQWVSVHDPDEYIASASDEHEKEICYKNILGAYKALSELKEQGKISKIGIGAKDWRIIERVCRDVDLDWVMFANSITILKHPEELISFVKHLHKKGVTIINSAVFHSGFLIGTNYYDYKLLSPEDEAFKELYRWRERFFSLCDKFTVKPAEACVQFSLNIPGIKSVALNTTNPDRVKSNIGLASADVPPEFWTAMKAEQLISQDYPFL